MTKLAFMFKKKNNHSPLREHFPYIQLLCWKSTNSHPGGVGLGYTEHISNVGGRDTEASARPSNSAV